MKVVVTLFLCILITEQYYKIIKASDPTVPVHYTYTDYIIIVAHCTNPLMDKSCSLYATSRVNWMLWWSTPRYTCTYTYGHKNWELFIHQQRSNGKNCKCNTNLLSSILGNAAAIKGGKNLNKALILSGN